MSDKVLVNDQIPSGQAAQMNDHASKQALQLLGEKATGKAAEDSVHTPKLTFEELGKTMGSAADKTHKKLEEGAGAAGGAVGKMLDGCSIGDAAGEALKQGAKGADKAAGEGHASSTELRKQEEKAGSGELKKMDGDKSGNAINDTLKQGSGKLDFDPKNMQDSIGKGAGEVVKNKAMNAQKGS